MPTWLAGGWEDLGLVAAKAALIYAVAVLGLRVAHRRTLSQGLRGRLGGRSAVEEASAGLSAATRLSVLRLGEELDAPRLPSRHVKADLVPPRPPGKQTAFSGALQSEGV